MNDTCNNFLNIYLQIFYACFMKTRFNSTQRYNPWITSGWGKFRGLLTQVSSVSW